MGQRPKSNKHWRIFQCVLSFKNKKKILFEKKEKGGHWVNTNDRLSHLAFACVRELVMTQDMG